MLAQSEETVNICIARSRIEELTPDSTDDNWKTNNEEVCRCLKKTNVSMEQRYQLDYLLQCKWRGDDKLR